MITAIANDKDTHALYNIQDRREIDNTALIYLFQIMLRLEYFGGELGQYHG